MEEKNFLLLAKTDCSMNKSEDLLFLPAYSSMHEISSSWSSVMPYWRIFSFIWKMRLSFSYLMANKMARRSFSTFEISSFSITSSAFL